MECQLCAPADEWVADFYDYRPGPLDPAVFETPKLCTGVAPEEPTLQGLGRSAGSLRMRLLIPVVTYGGEARGRCWALPGVRL